MVSRRFNKRKWRSNVPIEHVTGPNLPKTLLPYTPAVKAGGFVFVAGQASVGEDGTILPDTFDNEFHRTMSNLQRILVAAGADLKKVVQVRSYVRDPESVPRYNELYRQYFSEPYPARTTIVKCLGQIQFEIDVVAYVGS
jgi:2-iminobutanoate/2-iminopropanoate deaminase